MKSMGDAFKHASMTPHSEGITIVEFMSFLMSDSNVILLFAISAVVQCVETDKHAIFVDMPSSDFSYEPQW